MSILKISSIQFSHIEISDGIIEFPKYPFVLFYISNDL